MEKIRLFMSTKWPWVEDHIISAVITFFTGFCFTLVTQLQDLDVSKVEWSVLVGLFLACARAGFKMLVEQFLVPQLKKLVEYLKKKKASKLA